MQTQKFGVVWYSKSSIKRKLLRAILWKTGGRQDAKAAWAQPCFIYSLNCVVAYLHISVSRSKQSRHFFGPSIDISYRFSIGFEGVHFQWHCFD